MWARCQNCLCSWCRSHPLFSHIKVGILINMPYLICCVSSAAPEGRVSHINMGCNAGVSGMIWHEVLRLKNATELVNEQWVQAVVASRVTQLALLHVNSWDKLKRLWNRSLLLGAPRGVLASGVWLLKEMKPCAESLWYLVCMNVYSEIHFRRDTLCMCNSNVKKNKDGMHFSTLLWAVNT